MKTPVATSAKRRTPLRGDPQESRQLARQVDALMHRVSHLCVSHVTWKQYDAILTVLEKSRNLRHTYDRGRLEIMTRSLQHEKDKMLWAYIVLILAEEWDRPFEPGGELTIRREDLDRGIEPDQCFWIANAERVRGKKELDFNVDPPPDLFIEVEVSRTVLDRLDLLATLRVPEVWRVRSDSIQVGLFQKEGNYAWGSISQAFPGLNVPALGEFLAEHGTMPKVELFRALRRWLRSRQKRTARRRKE